MSAQFIYIFFKEKMSRVEAKLFFSLEVIEANFDAEFGSECSKNREKKIVSLVNAKSS